MTPHHPWLLLGPAYRWDRERAERGVPPRETRPAIQKYESAAFVDQLLADPRHSLVYTAEDEVHVVAGALPPDHVPSGPLEGRKRRLSSTTLVSTGTRKLYLPAHKRFYLVVCELHCDAPGLPSVAREQACEAGFVVRRRRLVFPEDAAREADALLRRLAISGSRVRNGRARVRVGVVGNGAEGPRFATTPAPPEPLPAHSYADAPDEVLAAVEALRHDRRALVDWVRGVGAVELLEGWLPTPHEGVGAWAPVAERPDEVEEDVLPLYPLVPDPGIEGHPAHGKTVYFGVIPTGSAQTDASGRARYDDATAYEVRCYVRRHRPQCPVRIERRDCRGPLFWSSPTEPFQLAPHADLIGTSNRPVTIQLPDVPMLAAQAAALPGGPPLAGGGTAPAPRGRGAPVKMVTPEGSALQIKPKGFLPDPLSARIGGPGYCTFAIPLITLVATFVLQLFLPIVVFLFNLWVLLKLRFCLPPSVELSAGLSAQLRAAADRGLDLDRDVHVDPIAGVDISPLNVQTGLRAEFNALVGQGAGLAITAEPEPGLSNVPLAELAAELGTSPEEELASGELSLRAGLVYEDEVAV